MTDEELEPFLNGSQGVAALDLARELLGTRLMVSQLAMRLEESERAALNYATAAEIAMSENAAARNQLHEMTECLAEARARVIDFLGEEKNDD